VRHPAVTTLRACRPQGLGSPEPAGPCGGFGFLIVFVVVVALAAISGVRSGREAGQPSGGVETLDSSMPANLLVGDDADRVAAHVGGVAGRRR
jgi:hypothetical protein